MTILSSFCTLSRLAGLQSFPILSYSIYRYYFILLPPSLYTPYFPKSPISSLSSTIAFHLLPSVANLNVTHLSCEFLVRQLQGVPYACVRDRVCSHPPPTAYHYSVLFFSIKGHTLSTDFDRVSCFRDRSPQCLYVSSYWHLYSITMHSFLITQSLQSLSPQEGSLYSASQSHCQAWVVIIFRLYCSIHWLLFIAHRLKGWRAPKRNTVVLNFIYFQFKHCYVPPVFWSLYLYHTNLGVV